MGDRRQNVYIPSYVRGSSSQAKASLWMRSTYPLDMEYFGRRRAEALYIIWFWQRFKEVEQSGWCPAPACYAHVWKPVRRRVVWQLFVGFLSCDMYVDTEDGV